MPELPMAPPGAPPAGAPTGVPAGPTGMATMAPQSDALMARGRIQVSLALKSLVQALSLIGPQTDEGQELAQAIAKLGKRFGDASGDLQKQEVKMLGQGVGAIQQPTPQQGQAFQQMIKNRIGQMGVGGGAPPGASPPAAA